MNMSEKTTCQDCGKVFCDEIGFKRHFRQYHKKKESDCHICGRKFNTEFLLKNHIGKSHAHVNCDICDKKLLKSALHRHKRTHQENVFKCGTCDNVYTLKDNLGRHMKTCGQVRREAKEAFNCDACGMSFKNEKYLTQHKGARHNNMRKKYGCNFCDKVYTSNQNLGKHMQKDHHNSSRVAHFDGGWIVFDSPMPSREVTKEKKLFKCNHCNYESRKKSHLNRHIESHTANRVKTGRPKKPPGELSSVTKRLYAKRSHNEFMEDIRKNNLEEEMIKLIEKDSRQKDPQVSKVTEKEVINMIADFDLSDIKMLKILRRLKKLFGKKAFTAGIREALIERKKGLTKYFKEEETTFYDSSGEELKRRFVYTEELEMLLEFILQERDIEEEAVKWVNVELDSGQKRMLVVLQIGDGIANNVKDTSTKRAIIIAFVDDIPETYDNLSIILDKLKVHLIKYNHKFVSDLKLGNILLGVMECGSRHGCPHCKGKKDKDGVWQKGDPRDLENLISDHTMWEDNSGKKEELKDFFNVKHAPLLQTPSAKLLENDFSHTSTLSLLPIPGLHVIKLGPVNALWKGLAKHLDDLDLETIEILIGVTRSDRQKNEFAGPECNLILSKLDTLRDLLPENLHIFVDALKQVKEIYRIAHATTVEVDHREKIELFRNTWLTLMRDYGQTMPLKIHLILDHLSDYFEMEGKTLRNTNDQFIESCHAKVRKFFDNHPNFKHKDKSTDKYGKAALAAVVHFNSNNLGSVQ